MCLVSCVDSHADSKTLRIRPCVPPIHEDYKIATVLFNICTDPVGNKSLMYGPLCNNHTGVRSSMQ